MEKSDLRLNHGGIQYVWPDNVSFLIYEKLPFGTFMFKIHTVTNIELPGNWIKDHASATMSLTTNDPVEAFSIANHICEINPYAISPYCLYNGDLHFGTYVYKFMFTRNIKECSEVFRKHDDISYTWVAKTDKDHIALLDKEFPPDEELYYTILGVITRLDRNK